MDEQADIPTLPMTVDWEAGYALGDERLDAEHRQLLAQCNALLAHCTPGDDARADPAFRADLQQLLAAVRTHLAAEAAWLAGRDDAVIDEHRFETEEFEYLAADVATVEQFDRVELQRFVALWCYGHVRGAREMFNR